MEFPIFKTKIENSPRFNLNDPKDREVYFELKAGPEIKKLRDYLEENTFIAYLLGKKNSGKGTYSKMFAEIIDPERIDHFSIGDMVRGVDKELEEEKSKIELIKFLEKNYRGFFSLEEIMESLEKRNTRTLLPTELILALVKREIQKRKKKALFIDGFPRDLDQISYSLFFRDLVGYRDDPDIFILIDVPEKVIDERMKWRRVCPLCQTSRNLKLLPSSKIGYDGKTKNFHLICDNPQCKEAKMVSKEGDEFGIEPIKERLKLDEKLIEQAFSLYGIPKILLRNSVPVNVAKEYVDDYEITPEYSYQWDEKSKEVRIIEKPWIILDDEGIKSYSLLAPPVVVSMIQQMAEVLNL
jgi:adenylate kinase family enzyme